MFTPRACFGGAVLAFLIAGMRFGATGGLLFAAIPAGFGIMGLVAAARDRIGR
jgi:hypothetical protein